MKRRPAAALVSVEVSGEALYGRDTTHVVVRRDGARWFGVDCPNDLDPAGLAELLRLHVTELARPCPAVTAAPPPDPRRLRVVRGGSHG